MQVFGENIHTSVTILSKNDLTYVGQNNDTLQPPRIMHYGDTDISNAYHWFGQTKKDITKIGPLSNTVIVDDTLSYTMKDQTKNLLLTHGESFTSFRSAYKFYKKGGGDELTRYIKETWNVDGSWSSIHDCNKMLSIYSLLYVVGVLDMALAYPTGLIEGISAIQWHDGLTNHRNAMVTLDYYKRGYAVLSRYTKNGTPLASLYPEC